MAVTNVPAPIAPGPMVHALAFAATTAMTLAPPSRAVWIASSGATGLVCSMNGDAGLVTFAAIPAGTWLWISIDTIDVTSTAAGVVMW